MSHSLHEDHDFISSLVVFLHFSLSVHDFELLRHGSSVQFPVLCFSCSLEKVALKLLQCQCSESSVPHSPLTVLESLLPSTSSEFSSLQEAK